MVLKSLLFRHCINEELSRMKEAKQENKPWKNLSEKADSSTPNHFLTTYD